MSKRTPVAVCRECGESIYNGDGKEINRKGEWTCTNCLIKSDKEKC